MENGHILLKKTVHAKDKLAAMTKLNEIIKMGVDHLQIISDFDQTISKSFTSSGERVTTTHGVFDHIAAVVNPELSVELRRLREMYFPIEVDTLMSVEQKVPHMIQWWQKSHDLISAAGFQRGTLEKFVRNANIELRDGFLDFLRQIEKNKIPLVVFSAGVGDVIKIVFEQQYGELPPHVHLISNLAEYDDKGTVVGFRPPLIHTFNKNSSVIIGERTFFENLMNRPNVLMMGDTLGDSHMDVGVVNEGVALKIGFLNQKVEQSLPAYLDAYDIVLAEDPTFDVPMTLLQAVLASK